MVCPQCGADHSSEVCLLAATTAVPVPHPGESEIPLNQTTPESIAVDRSESSAARTTSRLITFPGVTHRTVPPWRQELRERVREVQERRAQEAAAELATGVVPDAELATWSASQLELLPPADPADVNPLVAAALKRIERAHQPAAADLRPSYPARLTAAAGANGQGASHAEIRQDKGTSVVAVTATIFEDCHINDHQRDLSDSATTNSVAPAAPVSTSEAFSENEIEVAPERAINLVVVPSALIVPEVNPTAAIDAAPEREITKPKPRRIISDDTTDPALNYLDLVGTASPLTADPDNRAPLFSRLIAGVIDILCVCFLSVPFAALVELRNDSWRQPRVVIYLASVVVGVMFIYLTLSTAFTGKTLGVKILSLRVIDTRTRLIPTGGQAAGRAVIYIFSLATAGLCFLLALARGEGKTLHDRLSQTSVVRD